MWRAFCDLVERPEWKHDPRFDTVANRVRHRELVDTLLTPVMMERDAADWMALLGPAGIPCGPIRSVPEALEAAMVVSHPHPEAGPDIRSVALPFQIGEAPRASERGAPALGAHTDEVLAEWL
jgi:formyl-CoA transferase